MSNSANSISVIILTFNEEVNVCKCIESLIDWADEVFVVDSFSTDNTVALAKSLGAFVVQHSFEDYSKQWNWALENLPLTSTWTMKLDADERVTDAFKDEVRKALLATEEDVNAFIVHWHLFFMGRRLLRGGLYPNGNTRIWRTGLGRFGERGANEHLVIEGSIMEIQSPIEHHDYKSLSHWIDRHNRYSSMEAILISRGNLTGETIPKLFGRPDERRMWMRLFYYRMPMRALLYFIYRYILRFGFLDGRVGFRYIFLHSAFLYWIDLKRVEFSRTGVEPEVIWPARGPRT